VTAAMMPGRSLPNTEMIIFFMKQAPKRLAMTMKHPYGTIGLDCQYTGNEQHHQVKLKKDCA
jgi:hypothetical protein